MERHALVPPASSARVTARSSRAESSGPHARAWLQISHHPLLLLRWGWRPGLLLLVTAVATVLVATSDDAPALPLYEPLLLGLGLLFLIGGAWGGWVYLLWSYDALYLSRWRLVELTGVPYIREERRDLPIGRVQSVEVDQRGLLMRWCRCGDLVVDVAGGGPLRFRVARDAFTLRAEIMTRLAAYSAEREVTSQADVRAAVRELLQRDDPAPPLPASGGGATPPPRRRPRLRFGRQFKGAVWRRHPWMFYRAALAPATLGTVVAALPFAVDWLGWEVVLAIPTWVTAVGFLAAAGWLAWLWADWRNDHYVVMADRLIEIEQLPLGFRQQVSETALSQVQDIRYRVPSPLAQMLDYGDVTVHTAGATTPFVFRGIKGPRELASTIDQQVTASRLAQEAARYRELRAEFAQWLLAYQAVIEEDRTPVSEATTSLPVVLGGHPRSDAAPAG